MHQIYDKYIYLHLYHTLRRRSAGPFTNHRDAVKQNKSVKYFLHTTIEKKKLQIRPIESIMFINKVIIIIDTTQRRESNTLSTSRISCVKIRFKVNPPVYYIKCSPPQRFAKATSALTDKHSIDHCYRPEINKKSK